MPHLATTVVHMLRSSLFSWWNADTRAVEVMSAYVAFVWAASLEVLGERAATIYPQLGALMPLSAWTAAFAVFGIVQASAVCFNVLLWRRACCTVSWAIWAFIAATYFFNGTAGATAGVYIVFSASTCWVSVRGPSRHDRVGF